MIPTTTGTISVTSTGTYLIVGGLRLQVTVWTSILRITTVAEYLVKCYGNFIKMGVDGFRIDTSGHISRLTFCKQFIPQFAALGKQYEDKRLNKAPFFMYGEVCARFGSVQYRGQDNLSPYYYTWKAPKELMDGFDGSQSYWDTQEIYDSGTGYDAKLMPLCEKDNAEFS